MEELIRCFNWEEDYRTLILDENGKIKIDEGEFVIAFGDVENYCKKPIPNDVDLQPVNLDKGLGCSQATSQQEVGIEVDAQIRILYHGLACKEAHHANDLHSARPLVRAERVIGLSAHFRS